MALVSPVVGSAAAPVLFGGLLVGGHVGWPVVMDRLLPHSPARRKTPQSWEERRDDIKALARNLRGQSSPLATQDEFLHLLDALQDAHVQVRKEAIRALGHIGDERAVAPLQQILMQQHGQFSREAMLALASLQARDAIPNILAFLNSSNGGLRKTAVLALTQFQMAQFIPSIQPMLSDSYVNVRKAAEQALTMLYPLVQTVVFGDHVPTIWYRTSQALVNPDVEQVTVPMTCLETIVIDTETCDIYRIERFLTYAMTYLGQQYLKKHVMVQVYGKLEHLQRNLENNLRNLCCAIQEFQGKPVHIRELTMKELEESS